MAEAVFAHMVEQVGLDGQIHADSAGTGNWHVGEAPHSGTRKILAREGIGYEGRARLLIRDDLDAFDYIITMDRENLRNVKALGQGMAKVVSLMEFAPETNVEEVPDPYYDGRFEEVYRLVTQASEGLLNTIRREHSL